MGKRPRHSCAVTLATGGVFLLTAGFFLQTGLSLIQYDDLRHLPLSVPSWYFLLGGAVWGGLWLAVGIGLWRGRKWGPRLALAVIPVQIAAWAADRWLFNRSPISLQSIGFDAGVRLVLAGIGILIMIRFLRSSVDFTNRP